MSIAEFRKVYHTPGDDKEKYDISFGLNKQKLLTIGITIVYVVLIPILGYVVSTFIYMAVLCWFLGAKNLVRIAVFSLIVTAAFYSIFKLWLHARLPTGFLI
jgi:hypothetical protein